MDKTEEVVETEIEPVEEETDPGEERIADSDTESDAEASDETAAEVSPDMDLPSLPEPSAGLEYDAAKGDLVNADDELVYTLDEDDKGWTPSSPMT